MSPSSWGPPIWNFLHTLAAKIKEDKYTETAAQLFFFIQKKRMSCWGEGCGAGNIFPLLKHSVTVSFFLIILGLISTTIWFLIVARIYGFNFNFAEVYNFRSKTAEIIFLQL